MAPPKIIYQEIPTPQDGNPATMITALKAVIQNCQALTGALFRANRQTSEETAGPAAMGTGARVFCFRKLNADQPDPTGVFDGDQWFQPPLSGSDTWIKKIWFRGRWLDVP